MPGVQQVEASARCHNTAALGARPAEHVSNFPRRASWHQLEFTEARRATRSDEPGSLRDRYGDGLTGQCPIRQRIGSGSGETVASTTGVAYWRGPGRKSRRDAVPERQ